MSTNYKALNTEPTEMDVKIYRNRMDADAHLFDYKLDLMDSKLSLIVFIAALIAIAGFLFLLVVAGYIDLKSAVSIISVTVVATTLLGVVVWILLGGKQRAYDYWVMSYKLQCFANDNDWTYTRNQTRARNDGVLFSHANNYLYGYEIDTGLYTVGEFSFEYPGARERVGYMYVAISLDSNLPNMILDAKSNNLSLFGLSTSNLPALSQKNQSVSLEGDFDKYFTLYAPEGYQSDARYIFTPDIMALLMNNNQDNDAEIVDDILYIYYGKVQWLDETFWENVEKVVESVGAKTKLKSTRYKDDKYIPVLDGKQGVSTTGLRLKTSASIFGVVIFIAFVLFEMLKYLFKES